MKKVVKIMAVSAFLLGTGYSVVNSNWVDSINAQASKKLPAAKPQSYKTTAKKTVHFQKGALYSSAKLTKVKAHMAKYKHTTFYTSKQAKVVKANHKKAVYVYVKSSNGKTKGWVWSGYAKKGKAPKATTSVYKAKKSSKTISASAKKVANSKNSFGLKKGSTAKSVIKKNTPHGMKTVSNTATSIPGTNIKIKKGSVHSTGWDKFYAITTSGNRVYFKAGSATDLKYSMEVLPGLHSPQSNFTNSTGHWVVYMVSGNGVKPTATHSNAAGDNKGHIAAPVKGFKYLPDLYDGLYAHMPEIDHALEGNAAQYNYSKKIILITPSIVGVNTADQGGTINWGNN